jgi:ABC-type sugar transport system ATPase subunit
LNESRIMSIENVVVPRCSVRSLRKRYGGVLALDDVSIDFLPGEVHAILGENGAGKSTLMKILAGAESPDEGTVEIEGRAVQHGTVKEANANGIAIVFQELSLYPDLDVLANLFANREPRRAGAVDRRAMAEAAVPLLDELGLNTALDTLVEELALHDRQLLEIAKALITDVKVLILDEPTSSLSANETERLLAVIRTLRSRGVTIILVSHRLEEVSSIADRVTVLRDGRFVRTVPMAETTMTELVTAMIGRPPEEVDDLPAPAGVDDDGRRGLSIRGLSTTRGLDSIDLDARPGEIVGLAGLEDAGVQQLMHVVFGLVRPTAGEVEYPDGRGLPATARHAVRRRIALVPADRRRDGLMLDDSVEVNVSSVKAGVLGGYGFRLARRSMRSGAVASMSALRVKFGSLENPVRTLSGGNQQKIVLAKWLQIDPAVVLLDDPTRGVDLGAKLEIYEVIRALAARGCTVLFSSSELDEYRHLCRRVVVFRRGRVTSTLEGDDVTQHRVLHAMNV